jgi:hypothetical protein
MYARDTILTLKEQRPADPETDEDFAYNRVKVIGESPVSHSHKSGYEGADAAGVIVVPLANFGGTLDEPFGKLVSLYDVESIPEPEEFTETRVRVIDSSSAAAGPTPEEVLLAEAPGTPPEPGQKRGRTSPLGETRNEAASGPLGDAPDVAPPLPPEGQRTSPLDAEVSPTPVEQAPSETPPEPRAPASPLD